MGNIHVTPQKNPKQTPPQKRERTDSQSLQTRQERSLSGALSSQASYHQPPMRVYPDFEAVSLEQSCSPIFEFSEDLKEKPLSEMRLEWAIQTQNPSLVKEVLEEGADANARNQHGETPLELAIVQGRAEIMTILLERGGADPNRLGSKKRTPLEMAILTKKSEAIEILLDQGADPTLKGSQNLSPLEIAVKIGDLSLSTLLFQALPPQNMSIPFFVELLEQAAFTGQAPVVDLLLKKGMNINGRDSKGETALEKAVKLENPLATDLLLSFGADPYPTKNGESLFNRAVLKRNKELVQIFLNHHINPNTKGLHGQAPLHLAAQMGQTTLIKLLIDHGAYPDQMGAQNLVPLDFAIDHQHLEAIQILLPVTTDEMALKHWSQTFTAALRVPQTPQKH